MHFKPFEEPRDNLIEIMNELTIMSIFCICLGMITDDTLMSGQLRSDIGLAIILIVLINIVANFALFLTGTFSIIRKKLTKKCKGCKKRKEKIEPTTSGDAFDI